MKTNRNWQNDWRLGAARLGCRASCSWLVLAKVFGLFPPEEVAKLGLSLPIQVIGAGELGCARLAARSGAHRRRWDCCS